MALYWPLGPLSGHDIRLTCNLIWSTDYQQIVGKWKRTDRFGLDLFYNRRKTITFKGRFPIFRFDRTDDTLVHFWKVHRSCICIPFHTGLKWTWSCFETFNLCVYCHSSKIVQGGIRHNNGN